MRPRPTLQRQKFLLPLAFAAAAITMAPNAAWGVLQPAWQSARPLHHGFMYGFTHGSTAAAISPSSFAGSWVSFVAEAVLLGAAFWTLSQLRQRRLLEAKGQAEKLLADALTQLEAERSVVATLHNLPAKDRVTQVWNRTAIMEILVREMLRAVRENSPLGIIIVELDDLQGIHTLRGSGAAETVSQQSAERLISVMRSYDAVGLYRDNDFLIVLPGWNPEASPRRIVTLLDTIGLKPCLVGDDPLRVTSSLGVAAFDPRLDSPYPEELLNRADEALQMSKAAGPNHAVVAPR